MPLRLYVMYNRYNGFKIKTKHLKGYVKKDYQTPQFEAMLDQIDCWFITEDERSDRLREVTVAKLPLTMNGTTHYLSVRATRPQSSSRDRARDRNRARRGARAKAEQSWR